MVDISVAQAVGIFLWLVIMVFVVVKIFNDWEAIDKSNNDANK